jgi:uncharacterized protein YozE (UPF0346 family)
MNIPRDFIKLLLLVHMRYRNSFDSKDTYTWYLFESPSFTNKTQYFTILGKYMELMSECFTLIIQYIKNPIRAQPRNIIETNHLLMEVREMLDSLQFYMHCTNTHDCQASDKPIRILNTLCSTLDETFDSATGLDDHNAHDNLHKRHGISVV